MTRVSNLEAQFNRTHISIRDFEEAQEYLRSYRQRYRGVTRRALLLAAIVSYCRPFTRNKGGKECQTTPSLSSLVLDILTPAERSLHKDLLLLRHEALAHSDFNRKPTRRTESRRTGFSVKSKPFDLLSEQIDVAAFRRMCGRMAQHCRNVLFDLNKQSQAHEAVT